MLLSQHQRVKPCLFFLLFSFLFCKNISAQSYFKKSLCEINPICGQRNIQVEKRIEIHEKLLNESKLKKVDSLQFYSSILLFNDYVLAGLYLEAKELLLELENQSEQKKNIRWKAEVESKKAILEYTLNENHQNCLNFYLKAAEYSLQANDTVSYAENMEQASSMYGRMNQFKKAKQTFENVLPIIKASNYKRDIAISYSNFSNTLSANKNYKEAILYNDTAIYLASQVSDSNLISVFWDNMSYIKILEGNYTEAIAIAKKCIDINLRNRWFEPLINNYSHLEEASAKTNNYKDAYNYLIEYHFYNDSIKGTAMQIGINNIESKYVLQKKELDHQLQISKVNNLKKWLERLLWMILCVTAYLIFLYRKRNRKLQFTENELQIHKENLANLTQTLLLKNKQLYDAELKANQFLENQSKFIAPPTDEKIESEYIESFLDENMYNIRILTKEDWLGFKNSFEKVHPHFIEKIRIQYPTITEAEERMFVLIKLKMKTSEAAAILGISSDSVKKSKNRLKKKMNLSADDDLEIYINTF